MYCDFSGDYRKIRAVYDLLSRDSKFHSLQNIYTQQILDGLQAWLQGKNTFEIDLDPAKIIAGGVITDWDGWLRISVNLPVNEEAIANEFRESKKHLYNELANLKARWQHEPNKKFDDWYAEEVAAHGEALIRKMTGVQNAREFFASSIFRQIPVINIEAVMWAGLAHRFQNGMKDWKVSIVNDILAISAHLPVCDAMFLEKECANLLTNAPVKKHITYKTQIFSLQNKDKFLAYLKAIETSATKEHRERVQELYGKFWLMPFSKLEPSNLPT